MIRDMVVAILGSAPGIEVAEESTDSSAIRRAARTARADVVIVTDDAVSVTDRERLLLQECRLKLIALTTGGANAWLVALRPVEIALGELTAHELIDVIRSCAADD
jgi:hypothetical protein